MPYKKMSNGKYKVVSGKMKGKVVTKAQMQAIEISKHAGEKGATKPKKKGKGR